VPRIRELWRYPVKSMQGESPDRVRVGDAGVVGDRQWALVDLETGLALTARREPDLLFATAALIDDGVAITLPDGTTTSDDRELSAWLGHPVALTRADAVDHGTYEIALDFENESTAEWFRWDGPTWSFHDSTRTQVSIIGAGSLGAWDVRRFRPNVVVEGSGEDEWVGATVAIGSALLDVVAPIDRCVITTRPQPGGIDRDLDVLRTVNRDRAGNLGVGARVSSPGEIAVGDQVAFVPARDGG
jgi:MOSC domain-containing protein